MSRLHSTAQQLFVQTLVRIGLDQTDKDLKRLAEDCVRAAKALVAEEERMGAVEGARKGADT